MNISITTSTKHYGLEDTMCPGTVISSETIHTLYNRRMNGDCPAEEPRPTQWDTSN